jgi:hypothetical protein
MKTENSLKKSPEKNQLKDAVNTLKFFDHRIRKELSNRDKSKKDNSVPMVP